MKLKEKLNQAAGFTLVELIVVIAILAILAGVAVPVYSGYIEKANLAADQQLLAAVNRAFAAACAEAGIAPTSGTILLKDAADGNGMIVNLASIAPAAVKSQFATYYAGNEASAFKVYKSLKFENGQFVGSMEPNAYSAFIETIRETYGDQIADIAASTYGDEMGMTALMKQLDDVTVLAAGLSNTAAMNNVLTSNGFFAACAESMGIPLDGNMGTALNSELDRLAEEMVKNNPEDFAGYATEQEKINAAKEQVKANAVVLYTAKQTASMSVDEAKSLFTTASTEAIISKMTSTDSTVSGQGLAQAALVCGIYTAYVNREGSTAASKDVTVQTVLDALENDDGFKTYLGTEQGQKDLEGYLGALLILSTTTKGENKAEVDNLLLNGFGDQNLIDGLDSLMP